MKIEVSEVEIKKLTEYDFLSRMDCEACKGTAKDFINFAARVESFFEEKFKETKPLSFRSGKFYKTRIGEKAFISKINNEEMIGIIQGAGNIEDWRLNGSYFCDGDESCLDLVSEWSHDDDLETGGLMQNAANEISDIENKYDEFLNNFKQLLERYDIESCFFMSQVNTKDGSFLMKSISKISPHLLDEIGNEMIEIAKSGLQ